MGKAKVMVVEDNRVVAEDIKNNLVEMGYSVSAIATSGLKALEAADRETPDVAIMDIRLGSGMDGIETAAKLRERHQIPIIYLTAHADEDTVSKAEVTEPYACLVKPFDVEELQSAVEIAVYKDQMERKVRESKERLLLVMESAGEGLWEWDVEAESMQCDDLCFQLLGYEPGDVLDNHHKWWAQHIHQDDSAEVQKVLDNLMTGSDGHLASVDFRMARKDGEHVWINLRAKIVRRGLDGKPKTVIGILRDINDRKTSEAEKRQLENKLRQSQKMEAIGTLAGGIAHDFNNVLASVIGNTELALDDIDKDSVIYYNLNEILVAGLRAKDLARQILVFSRHADTKQKPTNMNDIVGDAIKLIRATIPSSIEIQSKLSIEPMVVFANPSQIHQIIVNLCTNSFHAMENDGGIMWIELKKVSLAEHINFGYTAIPPGNYARMTIGDNGHGIALEDLDKIFDPYFTTKDQEKGTGLGLSIVNGIVASHRGYITVDSKLDIGTSFNIYFPVVEKRASAQIRPDDNDLPLGSGERVIVVDDEPSIAGFQKQCLERLGYRVDSYTNSIAAFDSFIANPDRYDILVTDMTMPHMSGDMLVQRIREIRPGFPVILCTGFNEKADQRLCATLKINCFLLKPVDRNKLAVSVKNALKSASPSGSRFIKS
jgi:PAS domain S-box-containing protein